MSLKTLQILSVVMGVCVVGVVGSLIMGITTAVHEKRVEMAPPTLPMPATAR